MSKYFLPDSPSKAKRELLALEAYGMTKPSGLGLSIQVVMAVSGPEQTGSGADGSLAQRLARQTDPRQRSEDLRRHVLGRLLR
ncbi:hypothetical protein Q5P01_012758 [Channa striata]|uniref:Uncharacterized protein n=1 Tax=Channa striata TaxID=64152 RepID=A0AA88SND0_CHASR|nr:hypothetical protein Q5P01_012758 [Channa striata]